MAVFVRHHKKKKKKKKKRLKANYGKAIVDRARWHRDRVVRECAISGTVREWAHHCGAHFWQDAVALHQDIDGGQGEDRDDAVRFEQGSDYFQT